MLGVLGGILAGGVSRKDAARGPSQHRKQGMVETARKIHGLSKQNEVYRIGKRKKSPLVGLTAGRRPERQQALSAPAVGCGEPHGQRGWSTAGWFVGGCPELQQPRDSKQECKACLDIQPNSLWVVSGFAATYTREKFGPSSVILLFKLNLTFTLSNVRSLNLNTSTRLFPSLSFAFLD